MVWHFIGVYIINRTLHDRLEIRNFSSRVEKYFTRSLRSLVKYFSTLEEKFRISARPCNILYIRSDQCKHQYHEQEIPEVIPIEGIPLFKSKQFKPNQLNSTQIKSNQMLVFEERGKLEYLEKNLSEQSREPTNSAHLVRESNPSHIGGRGVLYHCANPAPPIGCMLLFNIGGLQAILGDPLASHTVIYRGLEVIQVGYGDLKSQWHGRHVG